ncbi:hypothetical protein [Flavobacterium poyangense]|uniref:hypothetical protein n=1 Tax=Flavobacterium poyangense TaxID=2204302 RepID=UPI00141F30E5|nr:hypothetical protein [Flavobacterium sp. JXAS1]
MPKPDYEICMSPSMGTIGTTIIMIPAKRKHGIEPGSLIGINAEFFNPKDRHSVISPFQIFDHKGYTRFSVKVPNNVAIGKSYRIMLSFSKISGGLVLFSTSENHLFTVIK